MFLLIYFRKINDNDAGSIVNNFFVILLTFNISYWSSNILTPKSINPIHSNTNITLIVRIKTLGLAEYFFCKTANPFNFGIVRL